MSISAICPVCGRHLDRTYPVETLCMPLSCAAWTTEAMYDSRSATWQPVDADGYRLDGAL